MSIQYLSHQDKFDSMNGRTIEQAAQLSELLHRRRNQRPFVAEISGDNGFQLTFGIGTDLCCAQHSRADGSQPYLMAVSPRPLLKTGYAEFLSANTPTPIAARYIISFDELKEIALYFLQTGERSDGVSWQVLDPRAIEEDAGRTAD
jgi:Immunity protein Imm1